MKIRFSVFLLFAFTSSLISQDIKVEKVEPPFWWIGMENSRLQLLVYGENISLCTPEINYTGVTIVGVNKVENPNYLFIDIEILDDASPGTFDIAFKVGDRLIPPFKYELKERNGASANRFGFDRTDAIYLLMPDRFSNGDPSNDDVTDMLEKADRSNPDGRHGGDINGIVNHLDYIKSLGFTALWINPLVENNNPEYSYHGYAITDFYNIDPRYGSNPDYLNLVNECHNKDMKVIMDMVFNHCSIHHWLIQDLPGEDWIHQFPEFTRSNFRASTIMDPYASEYDKTKMLTGWFDMHMADLDQRNELLSTYLIQNTIWWIEYSGIDGIRVDTQPYSYKEFISEWSNVIFNEYPNFSIVGETWLQKEAITSYFQGDASNKDEYNSNIPYTTDFPMYYAISNAFNENDSWTDGLARFYYVLAQDFVYTHPENNLIFCDNHDLNRYFSSLNEDMDKWKMGITFLLTARGIPMVYYGTEILMTGEEHAGHGYIRQDFPGGWDGDHLDAFTTAGRSTRQNEAINYIQNLLNWRQKKDVIHMGAFKHFVPENNTYVYFRYNKDECIMVAFNNSPNEMKAIKTDRFAECMNGYNYAINVLTGESLNYLDALTLPPKSAIVLELKK